MLIFSLPTFYTTVLIMLQSHCYGNYACELKCQLFQGQKGLWIQGKFWKVRKSPLRELHTNLFPIQ